MTRLPALLFDLDGTLVDSAQGICLALSSLAASRGGEAVALQDVRLLVSRGAATLVREALGPVAGESAEDLAAFRAILRALPGDPAMMFVGVLAALERLAEAGYRCAIVTNKPETLATQLLADLGLERYFDACVGGDTLHAEKPDPAPLHHALELLGLPATHHAVMIGDSDTDAAAAAAAAMPCVLFEGGYGAAAAEAWPCAARFGDFPCLPAIVEQLASLGLTRVGKSETPAARPRLASISPRENEQHRIISR